MKKFIIPALLASFMLVGCNVQLAERPAPALEAEETTESEDLLFENAKLINDFDVTDSSKPSIGIQRAGEQTSHFAIRFIAAIKVVDMDGDNDVDGDDLNATSAVWFRDVYSNYQTDKGTSAIYTSDSQLRPSHKAYNAFNNGGTPYTIDQFNEDHGTSYTHFVTYVLKNINYGSVYHYLMTTYLTVNGSTYSDMAVNNIGGDINFSCPHDFSGFMGIVKETDGKIRTLDAKEETNNSASFGTLLKVGESIGVFYRNVNETKNICCLYGSDGEKQYWDNCGDYFEEEIYTQLLKKVGGYDGSVGLTISLLDAPYKAWLNVYNDNNVNIGSQDYALGNTFECGIYPQSVVNDSTLISNLEADGKITPYGWYSYEGNYYTKITATPHAEIQDIYKKFDDGSDIVAGTAYWFKCEPIEWQVASSGGDTIAASTYILDAIQYATSTEQGNKYNISNLRRFLNENFLKSAFIFGSVSGTLVEMQVDNSADTTRVGDGGVNPNACETTNDYVTALCADDKKGRFIESDYFFSTMTSEYARARGVRTAYRDSIPEHLGGGYYYTAPYWTRSPREDNTTGASTVGAINDSLQSAAIDSVQGVRPVIQM